MDDKVTKQITEEELEEIKKDLSDMVERFAKKVSSIYQVLGYTWSGLNDSIPEKGDIKAKLLNMIDDLTCYVFRVKSGHLQVGYVFKIMREEGSIPRAYIGFVEEDTKYYYV